VSDTKDPRLHRILYEDLRKGDLRQAMARDLRDLYRFYVDEERRSSLASMNRVQRFFVVGAWLFRSLLRKLLPARRVLLLIALVLAVLGQQQWTLGGTRFLIDVRGFGFVLLLFVLMLELKDKLLARDEIEIARGVQLALLPKEPPRVAGYEIWSVTLPANDVGGDLVDYLPLPEGKLGAVLGDVAGKGLGAALLMAKLQATLRAVAPEKPRLEELGARLNEILCRDGLDNRYATLLYLELTPGSGGLRWLNAGHNPPYLVRAGDGVESLRSASLPLGMLPDVGYSEARVELGPGDLLVVYSDGLTEARDGTGEELGVRRLEAALPTLRGLPPEAAGKRLLDAYSAFVGEEPRHDDLSLLLVRRCSR
jgi:phosphoserine phosphatase RsbU/P